MLVSAFNIIGFQQSTSSNIIPSSEYLSLEGTLFDALKSKSIFITTLSIERTINEPATASVTGLSRERPILDFNETFATLGIPFRVISKQYKINKKNKDFLYEVTIELEYYYELLLNNLNKINPTGIYSYISIQELCTLQKILYKGTNYKKLIDTSGENLTCTDLISTGLNEYSEIIKKSTLTVETYEWGNYPHSHLIFLNDIISEIDITDNYIDVQYVPTTLTFDVDKDGTNSPANPLGQTITINPIDKQDQVISYGDENPDKPPEYIIKIDTLSLNFDVSGETKQWIIEYYEDSVLIKKEIFRYGFAYPAVDIFQPYNNTLLSYNVQSFWQLIEYREENYEYQLGYYTGLMASGWRMERFEIESPSSLKDKIPPTVELYEENLDPADLAEAMERYEFKQVPFYEAENFTLEPLCWYYKDIDLFSQFVVSFTGEDNTVIYASNPYQQVDYFISRRERKKYGIEYKELENDDGFKYIAYKGVEESEISYDTILPSINTNKNASISKPALQIYALTEYAATPDSIVFEVIDAGVSKEDQYKTYTKYITSQYGEGLYTMLTKVTGTITKGRPGAVTRDINNEIVIENADPTGDPYWDSSINPYWNKQYIIYDPNYSLGFSTVTAIASEPIVGIPTYSTIIYLNQFPSDSVYFNVFTPEEAFLKAKKALEKETTISSGNTVSFSTIFNKDLEEGDYVEIESLDIAGIIQSVNHNIECVGRINNKITYSGSTDISLKIIPIIPDLQMIELELDNIMVSQNIIPISINADIIEGNNIMTNLIRRGSS
jgi:hypothetical protein